MRSIDQRRNSGISLDEQQRTVGSSGGFYCDARVSGSIQLRNRNCSLVEGDGGQFLNSKTGKLFDPKNDPCMEKGATLAYYNEEATVATTKAVKEFLVATFHLKQ